MPPGSLGSRTDDLHCPGECTKLPKGCRAHALAWARRRARSGRPSVGLHAPGAAWRAVPLAEEGAQCSGGSVAPGATRRCSGGGSLRGLRTRSSSEGLGRPLGIGGCAAQERESNGTAPRAQGARTRPRIWPPLGQDRCPEGSRTDSRDSLPRAEQISASPAPEPPGPCGL